ncbi:hypothetical protein [Paenibacillus popilliae]|uniref:Histone acetyltransferase n=1 Tax=Paenibacillus popilliae ATCC 14706 TaxID=1212764 RepID=M9M7U1_PAEPP|nr:hypothetical protein [Paenibacillus popilliae]GAC43878.1 histone acetyltransferase [Paenibacillus popilliae ATCC 14706]
MNTFRLIEERVQADIYASQAEPADTRAIMSLRYRTAAWLNSKGSTQWNELLQGNSNLTKRHVTSRNSQMN